MKAKAVKIIEIVFTSIMGIIIVVLGAFIIQRLINKDKPVRILGFYLYEVDSSGSMQNPGHPDNLDPGDLIFVRKQKEYFVGDVVTYLNEGATKTITHKIVRIEGSTIVTQGIRPENSEDPEFDQSCIIGKVVKVWYGFIKFKQVVLSPYTIITLVIVGIAGAELLSLVEKKLTKKEKNSAEKIAEQKEVQNIENTEK